MAPKLKTDIDEGTSLTRGVQIFDHTSARRAFHVRDQNGTNRDNLVEAVEMFINDHDTSSDDTPIHPDYIEYNDLPLAAIHVTPWADGTAGIGVYRRTPATPPRFKAFEAASERWFPAGRRAIYSFSSDTYTYVMTNSISGEVIADWGDGWSRWFRRDYVDYSLNEITVRTLLDEHPVPSILQRANAQDPFIPLEDVSGLYSTINSTNFTIGNFTHPRGSLRIAAINVLPVETPGSVKRYVEYVFHQNPRTYFSRIFWKLAARCDDLTPTMSPEQGCTTSSTYVVIYKEFLADQVIDLPLGNRIIPFFRELDFNGLFPTHDELDGYESPSGSGSGSGGSGPGIFGGVPWRW